MFIFLTDLANTALLKNIINNSYKFYLQYILIIFKLAFNKHVIDQEGIYSASSQNMFWKEKRVGEMYFLEILLFFF